MLNNKRKDAIEDILRFAVATNIPVVNHIIRTCFYELLDNANASPAF